MQNTQSTHKHKCSWYCYACLIWFANLVLAVLSHFVPGLVLTAPILFLAVAISWGGVIILHIRERDSIGDSLAESDSWCLVAAGIAVVYLIVNSIGCIVLLNEGSPHFQNGSYYLYNKGIIREITSAEYDRLLIAEGRLFIGFLLLFSTLSLVLHAGRKNVNKV